MFGELPAPDAAERCVIDAIVHVAVMRATGFRATRDE